MPNHHIKLMSTPQCDTCGLYTCVHKTELTQPMNPLDLGETVGATLPDASTNGLTKVRVDIKPEETKTPGNIQCPECNKLVTHTNFCYLCGKCLKPEAIEPEKETATKNLKPKEDLTIKCRYCDMDVLKQYLAAHLNIHINAHTAVEAEPIKKEVKAEATPVKTPLQIAAASSLIDKDDVSLKAVDRFQYREIDNLSVSCSSIEDHSIYDFTVTVWLKDRMGTYNGNYAGSGWQASTDFERLVINTTFDATDEYYSVSVHLVKTNQYGYSTDDAVPERLCFDQTEICEEIKRALLFFKVPPRSVYKRFRKAIRNQEFIVELNDAGRVEYVQTANENDLVAKLKEKQTSSNTKWDNQTGHGYYGGCG